MQDDIPRNMSMYCLGTNPVGEQRKRKVSQETDQKTTFKTTASGRMSGRMTCWRFQRKTTRDSRREDGVPNGRVRPFERSFDSFPENEENYRVFDGVPNERMRPFKGHLTSSTRSTNRTE